MAGLPPFPATQIRSNSPKTKRGKYEKTKDGTGFSSGAIIRVKAGNASEVVVDGLVFPTSIAFDAAGDAYVTTNGVGAPGSGEVVKFAGLTSLAGTPLPTSSSTPASLPVTGGTVANAPWIALGAGIALVAAGFLLRRSVIGIRRS